MMHRGRGGMMHRGQGGMMQGMMGHNMPMKKYGMMVNHLPNLQNLFSLSDEQVENLLDLQTGFKKQQIDYRAEWRKKQIKLNSLLADNASASQVKKQMETCFETKIKMKVAAYETAGKMKAVLNSDQKKQLNNYMTQGDCMMNRGQGGMMNRGQGRMMNRGQGRMMQNRRLYNADDESKSKTKSK
jgi:hypothetical protein